MSTADVFAVVTAQAFDTPGRRAVRAEDGEAVTVSMNRRGRPLTSYRTIVERIGATTSTKGLRITAGHRVVLDRRNDQDRISRSASHPQGRARRLELHRATRRSINSAVSPMGRAVVGSLGRAPVSRSAAPDRRQGRSQPFRSWDPAGRVVLLGNRRPCSCWLPVRREA